MSSDVATSYSLVSDLAWCGKRHAQCTKFFAQSGWGSLVCLITINMDSPSLSAQDQICATISLQMRGPGVVVHIVFLGPSPTHSLLFVEESLLHHNHQSVIKTKRQLCRDLLSTALFYPCLIRRFTVPTLSCLCAARQASPCWPPSCSLETTHQVPTVLCHCSTLPGGSAGGDPHTAQSRPGVPQPGLHRLLHPGQQQHQGPAQGQVLHHRQGGAGPRHRIPTKLHSVQSELSDKICLLC